MRSSDPRDGDEETEEEEEEALAATAAADKVVGSRRGIP